MTNISEYTIQQTFHNWCKKQDFILASFHVPNGLTSNAKQGLFMKKIGLLKGVWDYWIITNKPEIVVIEFKDNKGSLTKEQEWFGNVLEKANIRHKVCRSSFEAVQFLKGE